MSSPSEGPSSYLDQGSGAALRAQLEAMKNGVYATMVSEDHTAAWDADQLGLQREINKLAGDLDGGVDPQVVTGNDDFDHLTLEQIRDLVYEIKPEVVAAAVEAWGKIGSGLGDTTRTLSDGLAKIVGFSWEGDGAKAAADSVQRFVGTSSGVAQSSSMVGMKVAFAQRGSDETSRMLGPVLMAAVPTAPAIAPPGMPMPHGQATVPGQEVQIPILAAQQGEESQKEETRQACLQVLHNVYSPGIRGGDQGVPVLPSVQPTANPVGPPGPDGTSGLTPSGPGISPGPSPGVEQGSGDSQPGGDQPGQGDGESTPSSVPSSTTPAQAGTQPSSVGTDTGGVSGPGLGSTNPAATSAAGYDPSGSGRGSSMPGIGGGVSGPGFGGGASHSGGGARPDGPGASVPGQPSGQPPAAPLGGPGQAGKPGGAGMSPGMMGRGAGGKSEDDKDRQSAEYLRGRHLEEWLDDGTRALPAYGAIGDQHEPGQPPPPQQPNQPGSKRPPGEHR